MSVAGAAITAGAGLLVVLLGYLVKFRGWTFLVAGYDESVDVDANVVDDVVGSMVLRVGVATLALAGLIAFELVSQLVAYVYTAAITIDVARTIYRVNTATDA